MEKVEKRYFTNWQYNRSKLFEFLLNVVENNDGALVSEVGGSSYKTVYEIHNRSILEQIRECETWIEWAERNNKILKGKKDEYIARKREEIKNLEEECPKPFKTSFTSYLSFEYDGDYYYIQMDDNPFFESLYLKVQFTDQMEIHGVHYIEEFDKSEWMFDCLFGHKMNDAEYKKIANLIFNQLVKSEYCKKTEPEYETIMVPNRYDGGYHREKVPKKERVRKYEIADHFKVL